MTAAIAAIAVMGGIPTAIGYATWWVILGPRHQQVEALLTSQKDTTS